MQVETVSVAGNACLCPQIILEDAPHESILLAAGNVVQSVAISSGNLKGTYRNHQDLVSGMCTVQNGADTLIVSASFDGQIDLWNPTTFEVVHSYQVNRPVIKLINVPFWIDKNDEATDTHSSVRVDCLVALTRSANPEKKSFDIIKITVADLVRGQNTFTTFGSTLTPRLESFAFDTTTNASNGALNYKTYFALVANGKKGLNFLICVERDGISSSSQQASVYYSMNDPVVAFATNASSGNVAVGHDNGQISILTNVAEFLRQFWQLGQKRSSEVIVTSYHWHAHPVLSLCFSPDGRLLYSGGEENVLVIWDLKDAGRNYLPRLGAPISRIIACQSVSRMGRTLITTVDNTLRLVNVANFEVEWLWQSANISTSTNNFNKNNTKPTINSTTATAAAVANPADQQRLQLLRSLQAYRFSEDHAERAWYAQCLINPRTGYLMINGNPGIMQEFDFYHGIIRQNHPLLQHHRVSRKDPGMRMFLPSITRFAVDSTGRLLVTIDAKRGEELPKEYSLKIWEWFPDNEKDWQGAGSYKIVAQLDKPHGDHPITCLAVSQQQHHHHHHHSAFDSASNDQLLASVMVVTGSNDGTIKLWSRKSMEDFQESIYTTASTPPTATNNSNHHATSNSKNSHNNNNSNGSVNNSAKKQYMLHKLRWKCHYAFTYRLAPVLAATFSLDSSLLILAHDNLVTCWDPHTVALKASLTLTIPRKVTYLSVIEPRASAEYGQGVGDVFLVAATSVSVSVFSLLTLQELWTIEDERIEAITTASSEQFALSAHVDVAAAAAAAHTTSNHSSSNKDNRNAPCRFQSSLREEAWIAVATSQESSTAANQQHQVKVFSPLSSLPLFHENVSLSSKITSLSFLRRKLVHSPAADSSAAAAAAAAAVMGLAVLTADSDVWVIQPAAPHPCAFTPGVTAMVGAQNKPLTNTTTTTTTTNVAQVKVPKLASVSFGSSSSSSHANHATTVAGDVSNRIVSASKATVAPMGRALANKDWLKKLLPENTEDLPKISDIAGSYLKSMMSQSNTSSLNNNSSSSNSNSNSSNNRSNTATATATTTHMTSSASFLRNTAATKTTAAAVATTMNNTKLPAQDTDELLKRVSAKWASVLGKRALLVDTAATSTSTSTAATVEAEAVNTPAKKQKKEAAAKSLSSTPMATQLPSSSSSSSFADSGIPPVTPVPVPVTTANSSTNGKKSASKQQTDKETAEKVEETTISKSAKKQQQQQQSAKKAASAVAAATVEEEVVVAAPVSSSVPATAVSVGRKRKGSDMSAVSEPDTSVAAAAAVAAVATNAALSNKKSKQQTTENTKKSSTTTNNNNNNKNHDDDDLVSEAGSTATDMTTPSVAAARRSARQKTMTLVSMAPAVATVATAGTESHSGGSRSTRSRK